MRRARCLTVLALALCVTCRPVAAQAPEQTVSEAGASIIQSTDAVFQLTGSLVSNFSESQQKAFSNQLRALLTQFDFMSIAVNGFTEVNNSYIDVTCRLVIATDAAGLSSTWYTIANEALVSKTLLSTFNALLQNSGLDTTVELVSLNGVTQAQETLITEQVNITYGGISGFNSSKQSDLLTPIKTFLGDHASIIGVVSAAQDGSVVHAEIELTLQADEIPQFFFYTMNSTAYGQDLAALGGNVTTNVTGAMVLSESGANANAPTPSALAPASAAAANVTSAVSPSGPLSADDVAAPSISTTPASVSDSASGTVTMDITMDIYGSPIVPFTSEKQFAAASSMAGVFSIIIGTGSVNILSSTTSMATSEPSSTAMATTPQYGRKLLQAASPAPGASTPVVTVVFAVLLPQASQNSLLVLQSNSPVVRKQFAGWFVTQMQARGYNVDANVQSVTVAPESSSTSTNTNTGSTATAPAAPAPTAMTAAQSTSSSTNVGAIVGGVVGGLVGLALVILLAVFLFRRDHRRRTMRSKEAQLASEDGNAAAFRGWGDSAKHSQISTKDAKELKSTVESLLSLTNGSSLSTPLTTGPLANRVNELDSAHIDSVRRLLNKRGKAASSALTQTTEDQASALMSALGQLEPGTLFFDKYFIQAGQRRGQNSIIALAHERSDASQQVAIKFIPDVDLFAHEKLFYENRKALEAETAAEHVPLLFDAYQPTQTIETSEDEVVPPSLVLERGNFSLAEWLSGKASLEGRPQEVDRTRTLYDIAKAVDFLHARNVCHRGLTPRTLLWFSNQGRWKLIDFGAWARSNEAARMYYELRYAAPEVMLADLRGDQSVIARESADMWSLGLISYEVLTGKAMFGPVYSDEEVMCMLLGFTKLPWEENPSLFEDDLPPAARAFVTDLLQRSPEARKPIRTALHSPILSTYDNPDGSDGTRTDGGKFTSVTGLFSTDDF